MLFPALYFFISIIGLGIASYTDYKTRMVYNKLTLPMAAIGIVLHAVESILYFDLTPIMLSIVGGAFGFIFAYILYKMGAWAGGDVKLLMAIGTLNPLAPTLLSFYWAYAGAISIPIFPLTFALYSILAIFPYILAISLTDILRHKEKRKKLFKMRDVFYVLGIATVAAALFSTINTEAMELSSLILLP